jgi:glutamate formiminotransferase
MREHGGVHPCIGAVDVVPFIPLKGGSLAVCAALGRYFARRLWERLRVPSYYYGAAAAPDRTRALVELRRGGFRGLTARMLHDRPPDAGEGPPHPTAGAAIVGARPVLVAFNVNLATEDAGIARAIARRVRESSGGVPGIQAMGVPLPSRGLAQVSMNLYDLSAVTPRTAFDAVRREADRLGVGIVESEIVGLSPAFALTETDARAIRLTAPAGEKSLDAALGRSIGCHEGVA